MSAGSGRPPASRRVFLAGAAAGTAAVLAVVLDGPGPPSALAIRELPVPVPSAGHVLIRVRAFGLNRLELYLRVGLPERRRRRHGRHAGRSRVPVRQIVEAHTDMEQNRASGKLVVTT